MPGGPACGARSTTTRVADGEQIEGRFVPPRAYAAMMYGAVLEAQGKLALAEEAYRRALRVDADSPEIWTRIGALGCELASAGHDEAFARALQLDDEYDAAFRERARCHLKANKPKLALRDAKRAIALNPRHPENNDLAREALRRMGDGKADRAWQRAEQLRGRRAPFLEASKLTASAPEAASARLDAALLAGDLGAARSAALTLHLPPTELALRAIQVGALRLGQQQAELLVAANPTEPTARVLALLAADLLRDEARFSALLLGASEAQGSLSPEVGVLFDALLVRRAGAPSVSVASTAPER